MTMIMTNTYKKTKTHIHRQRQKQSASRPNVCYIYQKQGVPVFKILYWLSPCDDKDKDKDKDKELYLSKAGGLRI